MIRYVSAGESHGPQLTVVLEGLPAGLRLDEDLIRVDLARRQLALGAGGRMAIETDRAAITSGVLAGDTTGAPVAMTIVNANHAAWKGREVPAYTAPRPGHADFAAVVKYGYDDIRPSLERASARETASRVAVGACCRALLGAFGIEVKGRLVSLGGQPCDADGASAAGLVEQAKQDGETLGGVIEVSVTGVPVGLGSHVSADRRLDGRLAAAVMSIPAMKGVEIGDGFALAAMKGTETRGRMGGVTGGISDGEAIVVRAAMKPIPTTLRSQPTVDLATGEPCGTTYERSDVCPVPRAVVVVESAVCLVIADALAEKLGGDSVGEMKQRFDLLPKTRRLTSEKKVFWP